MNGASKIYQEIFGFGLDTIPFLTNLATQMYVDKDGAMLGDADSSDSTEPVDFYKMDEFVHELLYSWGKSPSGYCSVIILYHYNLLILQDRLENQVQKARIWFGFICNIMPESFCHSDIPG
jgi:hypothetical protein